MANVTITQLPAAGPITGTESVPIVQNGQTVQTTTAAIAAAPAQTQTFLTVNQEPTLPNSRYLSTGTGLGMVDGGEQSFYRLDLNGVSGSLETASQGILAKDSSTVYGRVLTASGSGLSITDGNGVNGNPTFQLTGLVQSLANLGGSGMLFINSGSSLGHRQIDGTADQVDVANATGVVGNPTISLADNPVVPGTYGITVPSGTTAERGIGANGQIRYNTTLSRFEGFHGGSWSLFGSGDGTVTSVNLSGGTTGLTVTGGPITSSGTLVLNGNPTLADNLTGGGANQIAYQSAENTTAFVDAPTSSDTFLKWDGSNLVWGALPGGGTVTSVGLALPTNDFEISNSPVTSSGTLTGAWKSQLAKTFLAAPNADAGTPSFREIVASDIPTLNQNTTGQAGSVANSITFDTSGGAASGSTYNGSAARTVDYSTVGAPKADGTGASGTWSINVSGSAGTASNVAGGDAGKIVYQTAASTTGFIDAPTSSNQFLSWTGSAFTWAAAGSGTVTSVGLSLPSEFTISNSPVIGSGTLTGAWANQTANYVFAGPTTGSAATPGFRALVDADIPSALTGKSYNGITPTSLATGWKASGGTTAVEVSFLGGAAWSLSGTDATAYTLPSSTGTLALNNQQFYLGTTQIAIDRASASISLTGVSIDGSAGSAGTATNVSGGAAGSILYQSAASTTTSLALGTQNYILTAGASAPQYTQYLSVAQGGTGATTLTGIIKGNGTSAFTAATAGTDYVTPTGSETLTNKTIEAGTFTNGYTEEVATANTGTTYTIDLANGSLQILTLTGNCTFTFPTATAGKSFLLLLRQDGTGSRTVTWPASVKWPGGTAPTITATASKQDILSFVADGTNWYGVAGGQNYTV